MKPKYEVIFLNQAIDFMASLDTKSKMKIYYNIDRSKSVNDPELFKTLDGKIWEFRTKYSGLQYRLLAFWDKTDKTETLVLATHGIVKKTDKVPKADIDKAKGIMAEYFNNKTRK